jgi:hypothetical protein
MRPAAGAIRGDRSSVGVHGARQLVQLRLHPLHHLHQLLLRRQIHLRRRERSLRLCAFPTGHVSVPERRLGDRHLALRLRDVIRDRGVEERARGFSLRRAATGAGVTLRRADGKRDGYAVISGVSRRVSKHRAPNLLRRLHHRPPVHARFSTWTPACSRGERHVIADSQREPSGEGVGQSAGGFDTRAERARRRPSQDNRRVTPLTRRAVQHLAHQHH